MLTDEVRQVLIELAESIDAIRVSIEAQPPAVMVAPTVARALGSDRHLVATLGAELEDGDEMARDGEVGEAMERAVRALRTAARRWGDEPVPLLVWPDTGQAPTHARVIARLESYLDALANSAGCRNALLSVSNKLVASAHEPEELDRERIAFTRKRVDADAASREGTSFGEVVGDDCYARSFWVGAMVVLFFDGPWAIDFVRHRVRSATVVSNPNRCRRPAR